MDITSINSSDCAALLGVKDRRARQLLAELEQLGFCGKPGSVGTRIFPRALLEAVVELRAAGLPLQTLLDRRDLDSFKTSASLANPDTAVFEALVQIRAEVGMLREGFVAVLAARRRPTGLNEIPWGNLAIPDPREGW